MGGDVDFLREALWVLVEGIMDAEVSAQIGAEHGERNPERITHRCSLSQMNAGHATQIRHGCRVGRYDDQGEASIRWRCLGERHRARRRSGG